MRYDHNQICTSGKEVIVGGEYQYKEDSYICDVTVLEDISTGEWIGFKLRVDEKLYWPSDEPEFTCEAATGHYAYSGMWRLYDRGEYVRLAKQED